MNDVINPTQIRNTANNAFCPKTTPKQVILDYTC